MASSGERGGGGANLSLEDRIFRKNIPGVYSSWYTNDDDDENKRKGQLKDTADVVSLLDNDSETADEDAQEQQQQTTTTTTTTTHHHHHRPMSTKAGPKGVIHQQKLDRQWKEQIRQEEERDRQAYLERVTRGAVLPNGEGSISGTTREAERKLRKKLQRQEENNDDDFSYKEEVDQFMLEYRQRRLMELKKSNQLASEQRLSIHTVDQDEFVEAVNQTMDRWLIILIYDSSISGCVQADKALKELAFQVATSDKRNVVEFLRLQRPSHIDSIVLPAMMLYYQGELLHNLTPLSEYIPTRKFGDCDSWRSLLERKLGVTFLFKDKCSRQSTTNHSGSLNVVRLHEEESEDDEELEEMMNGFQGVL